jgi:magnesium transporter
MSSTADADLLSTPLFPDRIENYVVGDVPVCSADTTAAEVRQILTGGHAMAADIAVCETDAAGERRLLGLIPVTRCLSAASDETAATLMDADPPIVTSELDQEQAAWKAAEHGESSLAVVDPEGRFLGLVPPGRLLAVLLHEHDVDLARLGGYLRSTTSSRKSLDEQVPVRLWHRLPWLLVGLIGSALAALLVDGFEESLSADLRLAFFIPGIVYMADAVGTQTETLVIRGLGIGVGVRRVFVSEALTGLLLGLIIAAAAGPAVALILGSAEIGLAVALALLAACSIATIVAMALPWTMDRIGRDPAYGSGPLATVIQDLLSLAVYVVVVRAIIT